MYRNCIACGKRIAHDWRLCFPGWITVSTWGLTLSGTFQIAFQGSNHLDVTEVFRTARIAAKFAISHSQNNSGWPFEQVICVTKKLSVADCEGWAFNQSHIE